MEGDTSIKFLNKKLFKLKILNMKKLFTIAAILLASNALFAQNTYPWPSSGNIGIGTASPAFNLDVSSAAATTLQIGTTTSTGNPNLIFKGSLGYWKVSKTASAGGPSAPSQLDFTYNTSVYGGDRPIMSLFYNGSGQASVVIGTNTTSIVGGCVLGVEGKIGARELVISNATPFPDYVFAPNYKLRPLAETEKFIKQYSHLPEMPSAEDVKKDGLEVGKMTTILVQKVEELTLQMIEMNKKIEKLEKENEKLKSKL
jgi:hypothetical protein